MICAHCKSFFAEFKCSAVSHGECDCPKCQGYCICPEEPVSVTINRYLDEIEKIHVDTKICYHPVLYSETASIELWVMGVVVPSGGYYQLSEDYFMGTLAEMQKEATRLNTERLKLSQEDIAKILISSMREGRKGNI